MLLVLLIVSVSAESQIGTLLPSGDSVAPWEPYDKPLQYGADNLFDFINGGAEIYLEYGFVEVTSQEYVRDQDSVICTIYEMTDPQAAFGIFSYQRNPKKRKVQMGDGGFQGGLQMAFWQHRYYVTVESFSSSEELDHVIVDFARRISSSIDDHAEEPAVMKRLPPQGLLEGSAKLLKGHLGVDGLLFLGAPLRLDLAREDSVIYGEYESAEGRSKLFLVVYQEEARAGVAFTQLDARMEEHGAQLLTRKESRSFWKQQDGFLALSHGEGVLALVSEAPSLEQAEILLKRY